MTVLSDPVLTLSGADEDMEPLRPEDYDAEDPEKAELVAVGGREEAADLESVVPLVALLDAVQPSVVCDAANALYNLSLLPRNAAALQPALSKLASHLGHKSSTVRAAIAGTLMNVCANSGRCRSELFAKLGLLSKLLSAIAVSHAAAPSAAPSRAMADSPPPPPDAAAIGELETRRNSLGALNNLLLQDEAAAALRDAGGIEVLVSLLRDVSSSTSEARMEDAATSLLRALQEDAPKAGEALVECGGLPVLVMALGSPNEELQVKQPR